MYVLGIESSCDETGVAIYHPKLGLLADALSSQIKMHQPYGGVVPELASRDHLKQCLPLVERVLDIAQLQKQQLNAIAYTAGPGLVGALLTGACFAKGLAFALQIPAIAVHHLEAHVLSAQLDDPTLKFPFVILLVSGGHTQLLHARALGDYQLLGDTLDDAVGEAFDKTAKLMGIAYPGGAKLAEYADQCQDDLKSHCLPFPRPMTQRPGLEFSFSGLKTHASTVWRQSTMDQTACSAISYAFQAAVVDTLVEKCRRALAEVNLQRLVVAGGVSANKALRTALNRLMNKIQGQVFFPRLEYCTDNGAMVAYAGCLHLINGSSADQSLAIQVNARWPLGGQNAHET